MRLRAALVAAAIAALPLVGACDRIAQTPDVSNSVGKNTTIDPTTGEPVATNYQPTGQVFTFATIPDGIRGLVGPCAIDDPSCGDPCTIDPSSCEPPPPPPECVPGVISTTTDGRTGTAPTYALEVSGKAGASTCDYYVLKGIGGRVDPNNNWTTLVLKAQKLNADGTLGPINTYRYGSAPTYTPEAYIEATGVGEVITGVGVGQSGATNLRSLEIYTRQIVWTGTNWRLSGATSAAKTTGEYPAGPYDASYVSYDDTKPYVGAGFRSNSGHTTTMADRKSVV